MRIPPSMTSKMAPRNGRLMIPGLAAVHLFWTILIVVVGSESVHAAVNKVHLCGCNDSAVDPLRGCDSSIRLKRLQIGKVVAPGRVYFKYKIQIDRVLETPQIDFTLSKLTIPLPCMGGYGSCTYSLCGYEQYSIEKKICAAWGCKCPVSAGTYYSGLVSIGMPDLRQLGAAAYGPVQVEVTFREGERALHCSRFKIDVLHPDDYQNTTEAHSLDLLDDMTEFPPE